MGGFLKIQINKWNEDQVIANKHIIERRLRGFFMDFTAMNIPSHDFVSFRFARTVDAVKTRVRQTQFAIWDTSLAQKNDLFL